MRRQHIFSGVAQHRARERIRILLKLESENPTGSMKDRMALAMIEAAEGDGRLTANGSVVEYTGLLRNGCGNLESGKRGYLATS